MTSRGSSKANITPPMATSSCCSKHKWRVCAVPHQQSQQEPASPQSFLSFTDCNEKKTAKSVEFSISDQPTHKSIHRMKTSFSFFFSYKMQAFLNCFVAVADNLVGIACNCSNCNIFYFEMESLTQSSACYFEISLSSFYCHRPRTKYKLFSEGKGTAEKGPNTHFVWPFLGLKTKLTPDNDHGRSYRVQPIRRPYKLTPSCR